MCIHMELNRLIQICCVFADKMYVVGFDVRKFIFLPHFRQTNIYKMFVPHQKLKCNQQNKIRYFENVEN